MATHHRGIVFVVYFTLNFESSHPTPQRSSQHTSQLISLHISHIPSLSSLRASVSPPHPRNPILSFLLFPTHLIRRLCRNERKWHRLLRSSLPSCDSMVCPALWHQSLAKPTSPSAEASNWTEDSNFIVLPMTTIAMSSQCLLKASLNSLNLCLFHLSAVSLSQ
jgi:hypothetical protein